MKGILAALLLLPALAFGQQTDPTPEEFAASVSVMVRYLEAIRRTQQTETADIRAIQDGLTLIIEQTNKRLDALEAAQKAQPVLRAQQITIMTP